MTKSLLNHILEGTYEPGRHGEILTEHTCVQCGEWFVVGGKQGPVPKYCSDRCRDRWHHQHIKNRPANKECVICHKPFFGYSRVECCSLSCSSKKSALTNKANGRQITEDKQKVCVVCGGLFWVDHSHLYSKGCSKRCYDALYRKNNRDKCRDKLQRYNAKKHGNIVEQFNPLLIYERDNWICQICGKKVKRNGKAHHPLQPSIDHIIPISLGGSHSRLNVRCTHLNCNLTRGNRGPAQLLLVN